MTQFLALLAAYVLVASLALLFFRSGARYDHMTDQCARRTEDLPAP